MAAAGPSSRMRRIAPARPARKPACPATCGTAIDAAHSTDTLQPMDANGLQTKVCFSQLQSKVQYVLLVAALVSVPLLLLPIPFIEMFQAKQARAKVNTQRDKDM